MAPKPRLKPQQWRSLEQLADTPQFQRFLHKEYGAVSHLAAGPDRRQFLRLMAASFALAGLAGCDDSSDDSRSQEVPWVTMPQRQQPSQAMHYASIAMLDGFANGILVTTVNGRPIKIEGNPQHPWSRGGTDVFGQASILDMYDPGRSQSVRHLNEDSSWQAFRSAALGQFAALRANGGEGLRLLTGPVSSPSLRAQIAAMQRDFPQMHWHSHAAADRSGPLYAAAEAAFGRKLETRWRFDRARVLVAFDGDFLDPGPQQVGVSLDWSQARAASAKSGSLLPLFNAGSLPTLTSAKADHPLVATPAEVHQLVMAMLAEVSGQSNPPPALGPALDAWRGQALAALQANSGAGLVIAGSSAPVAVQEAVHRLNAALGNAGQTVLHTSPVLETGESLADLAAAMRAGAVTTLVMLDSNPVYDAPGSLHFTDALSRVPMKIHAGAWIDETTLHSDWHLPLNHPLESWGDARSIDGTVGLMQPMIEPLYQGKSPAEILSLLTDPAPKSGLDLLRGYWGGSGPADAFEPKWEAMMLAGFIADSALPEETVTLVPATAAPAAAADTLSIAFRPDPTLWDGRSGNNGWLQELPKPLTKITWDNAVAISPALAGREGLRTGDVVAVRVADREISGAVWVMPGQADQVVALTLGYGRFAPDMLSSGAGYNAAVLRGGDDPWAIGGVSLHKTGQTMSFATTQDHNTMEGHDFVRVQREGEPAVGETQSWSLPTLYTPPREDKGSAWGMVIDLDTCIGCNACVVACQSENNIAVVGREQVALGREMHWLRVDRYYAGSAETPATHFQPVPCMHCEQAPCEVGCPVEATLHDGEGLNVMVYNRCVGTRACSGYCPYKVRRFNYFDYAGGAAPSLALHNNPDVSVRSGGVMEKCTYCIQRIENARIDADKRNGFIADGVVQTACQTACPTRAITFGDLHDQSSAVTKARADERNYALLGELNVRPRTTYLAERAPRSGKPASAG